MILMPHNPALPNTIKIAHFLAIREIRRTSPATTALIVIVMTLTFLNLIVGRGILVGLPQGAIEGYQKQYSGDVLITKLDDKKYILRENLVQRAVQSSNDIAAYSERHIVTGTVTTNYKETTSNNTKLDQIRSEVTGINPNFENDVTSISNYIVEGEYLNSDDRKGVVIGSIVVSKFQTGDGIGEETLKDVDIGSKVELDINGNKEILIVRGFLKTKVSPMDRRIYVHNETLRSLVANSDYQVDEIAIKAKAGASSQHLKDELTAAGIQRYAKISKASEAQPQFVEDVKVTFSILGNVVGTIGLIVASITIFIIIFVNAITKRKYIGILKGIGISSTAIELSYVFQSIFYAITGAGIGLLVLYLFLVPYFIENPIDFPFADGLLLAEYKETAVRTLILFTATVIAGYIPARLIVKQNTLDAILGR